MKPTLFRLDPSYSDLKSYFKYKLNRVLTLEKRHIFLEKFKKVVKLILVKRSVVGTNKKPSCPDL